MKFDHKAETEHKNELITRMEEVLDAAKAEQRELTEDEAAELAEIRDNVRRIVAKLDADSDLDEMKSEEETADDTEREEKPEMTETETRERNAFENYLRGFIVHERTGELTPDATSGGALIPTTIVNYVIRKVYDICPILDRSQKFNVKGKLEVPYYPYDSNNITVAYKSEFSALTSSSGKFATIELGGFLAGCLTKISRSLINNTAFDLVGFVVDEMAYAIARFLEKEMLDPSDPSNKVKGLSELTNVVTAAAADAITADEVVTLHDAIKDQFQQNAIWIMSPSTRTALRLLKDNYGRYMLQDDISLPFGVSLLGKPVYVSDNMPEIATKKNVIYYGDMRGLATKFSEDINIEVLRERFADEHAIGVVGWLEFDSRVIDNQQIAVLKMA